MCSEGQGRHLTVDAVNGCRAAILAMDASAGEFGKFVSRFLKTLLRGSLEPKTASCCVVLSGKAFQEISAEHELGLPVPALGRGRKPFLRLHVVDRQSLAGTLQRAESKHCAGMTVGSSSLEQLYRGLRRAFASAPIEQHLGKCHLRIEHATLGRLGKPVAGLLRVGCHAAPVPENTRIHVLGLCHTFSRSPQPSRGLSFILVYADALGETQPEIEGGYKVAR